MIADFAFAGCGVDDHVIPTRGNLVIARHVFNLLAKVRRRPIPGAM
jgi:hypothetical protein